GIVSTLSSYLGVVIGLWEAFPGEFTFIYFLTQLFAMIEWNILWGALFGFAFAMTYDRIPGKGIIKGLVFSFIFYWLLADIRTSQILLAWGETYYVMAAGFAFVGFFAAVAYGAILGYFYKK
ncbi:MAG: hypothetical protein ACW98I_21235, partial [Candidatus Hodarchaeales archaeon]